MKTLTATAFALICLAVAAAPADARRGKHGKHLALTRPGVLELVADRLDLDATTTDEIRQVVHASEKDLVRLQAEAKLTRMRLRRLMEAPGSDRSDVLNQVDAVGAAELAVKRRRVEMLLDVRAHLTPEQVAKLGQVRRELKREKWKRKGRKAKKAKKAKRHRRRWRGDGDSDASDMNLDVDPDLDSTRDGEPLED